MKPNFETRLVDRHTYLYSEPGGRFVTFSFGVSLRDRGVTVRKGVMQWDAPNDGSPIDDATMHKIIDRVAASLLKDGWLEVEIVVGNHIQIFRNRTNEVRIV